MLEMDKSFFQEISDYLSLGKCLHKKDALLSSSLLGSTLITDINSTDRSNTNFTITDSLKADNFIESDYDYSVGVLIDRIEDALSRFINYEVIRQSIKIQNMPFVHLIDRLIGAMKMPLADPSLVASLYDYYSKNDHSSGVLVVSTGRDIIERPVILNRWRQRLNLLLRPSYSASLLNIVKGNNQTLGALPFAGVSLGAVQFVRGPFISGRQKMRLFNPNLLGSGAIFSSYQRLADIANLNGDHFTQLAAWRAIRHLLLNDRAQEIRLMVQEADIPFAVVTPYLSEEVLNVIEDGVSYHGAELNLIKRLGIRSSTRSSISELLPKYPLVSLGQLMRTVLRDYVHSALVQSEEFFCRREVMSLWRRHLSVSGADYGEILWRVVVMVKWFNFKKKDFINNSINKVAI